ncbi:MAG: tRNA (adenosine(37)-N6)-threonylcarbamoyltransferase complex dimerization subunit type 1 TsaB [bacterium]
MKILAITTTHRMCGCAVSEDENVLAETLFEGYRSCVEELAGRISETLEKAGLSDKSTGAVAVDIGPGGLTGLKIGVVTAKTIAQVRGLPVVGLSSFEILAADAPPEFGRVAAIIHSSRDEFYFTLLRRSGGGFETVEPASCLKLEEIERKREGWEEPTYVTGGGVEKLKWEPVGGKLVLAPADGCFPRPSAACRLAAAALHEGRGRRFDEVAPLYVSLTGAEKNLAR